ncbi:D-galactarate dehydratase [Rubellimicrobium roseum]|uniref:D-galactarate dehydratase n=1 Tax=Rubellimicrobium roseum TaxID=687525 RepID=A0A5C4NL90_9RHOB|nr:D-galactarate dehydratase [Rubellimicrobium roseum]
MEAGGPGLDPAVTASQSPVARPSGLDTTPAPVPAAVLTPLAPVTTGPLDPLAPPPAAEGIAVGEPAPTDAALVTPPSPAPTGALGTTVASLGSPTNPGRWLETPLVAEPTQGRVEYNGQSVNVELRPSGGEPGSGSQISLEAMRALGAPLTGLPELTVFGG